MTKRPSGYYWVIFSYPNQPVPDWEPAEYDAETESWMLIGNKEQWSDDDLSRIGGPVAGRPPTVVN